MDSWANGAKGSEVKRVIDSNFDILDKRTAKMNDDISKLINSDVSKSTPLSIEFIKSEWSFVDGSKTYIISIPYDDYNRDNPCVEVYIKESSGYSPVWAGYTIGESGIDLQSDMPYEGKVVIR